MAIIELRATTKVVINPSYDSRTKDISKHGLRTVRIFEAGTRFQHVLGPRNRAKVSIINQVSEHDTTDDQTIAALLAASQPVEPADFREAVMAQYAAGFTDLGESVIDQLLATGKLTMTDLHEAIGVVLKGA